ncbi:MAG: methyltransferase domain-containing protein [Dehalococcoidia bacterium]
MTSDTYTHGHHPSVVGQHARRTAGEAAAFLLPHLRPGMRLLDFGCGPGSITVGLAEAVAPGIVSGIDIVPDVIEQARALTAERGVENVEIAVDNVYELSFADGEFDVAYGHQVLQHLARPIDALAELKRVLKSGGLLAVRDGDYASMMVAPDDPGLDRFFAVYQAVARRNGGEPNAGRYLRGWLQEAGYEEIEVSAQTWVYTSIEDTTNWGDSWAERVTNSTLAEQALAYGIASPDELESIGVAWREWARKPDAFFSMIHVAALGRRP